MVSHASGHCSLLCSPASYEDSRATEDVESSQVLYPVSVATYLYFLSYRLANHLPMSLVGRAPEAYLNRCRLIAAPCSRLVVAEIGQTIMGRLCPN